MHWTHQIWSALLGSNTFYHYISVQFSSQLSIMLTKWETDNHICHIKTLIFQLLLYMVSNYFGTKLIQKYHNNKITSNTEITTNFCSDVSMTNRLQTEVKGATSTPSPHWDQVSVNFSSLSTVFRFCISSRTPSRPEQGINVSKLL